MEEIISALDEFYQERAIKNQGLYNSLLVKLQAAQKSHHTNAVLGQLNAFSEAVKSQSGKGITAEASQSLLDFNEILIAHINPEKTASGTNLTAIFKSTDYKSVVIEVRETPTIYKPVDDGDSRVGVGEITLGILNLYYTDSTRQWININRSIEINNTTKAISYNGVPVTTLKDIFGELSVAPTGNYMYLLIDFPYWLTIFMKPVSHFYTGSRPFSILWDWITSGKR